MDGRRRRGRHEGNFTRTLCCESVLGSEGVEDGGDVDGFLEKGGVERQEVAEGGRQHSQDAEG